MTNAQKIADKLVGAGILAHDGYVGSGWYLPQDGFKPLTTEQAITDWRVAGKCLESMRQHPESGVAVVRWVGFMSKVRAISLDDPLPRSIIEAWFAAQENAHD